jgi:hypothetical protein
LYDAYKIHIHAQSFAIPEFKQRLQLEIDSALAKFK